MELRHFVSYLSNDPRSKLTAAEISSRERDKMFLKREFHTRIGGKTVAERNRLINSVSRLVGNR